MMSHRGERISWHCFGRGGTSLFGFCVLPLMSTSFEWLMNASPASSASRQRAPSEKDCSNSSRTRSYPLPHPRSETCDTFFLRQTSLRHMRNSRSAVSMIIIEYSLGFALMMSLFTIWVNSRQAMMGFLYALMKRKPGSVYKNSGFLTTPFTFFSALLKKVDLPIPGGP